MEKTDRMFSAHIKDLAKRCRDKSIAVCSGFLDLNQQNIVRGISKELETDFILTGGYEDAERKLILFFPDYEINQDDFLCVLRFSHSGREKLSHRDYLGALMGLGIERQNIGDILVFHDGAQAVVKKEMSEYLKMSCNKAGKTNLETEVLPISSLVPCEATATEIKTTVSSLRADALLSAAFNLSRGAALEAVRGQKIYVNDILLEKPEKLLKAGDKIKFHRHGRVILTEIGNTTRKGRISVKFDEFK